MKKLYFLLIALFVFTGVNAQVVNIPDANFKARLLLASPSNFTAKDLAGNYFKIDANNNGEIEVSEASQVSRLDVQNSSISSLEGILNFNSLQYLDCQQNSIANLNIGNITLDTLNCSHNLLVNLSVSNVFDLNCSYNNLTSLTANFMQYLNCSYNKFTTLDFSNLTIFYRASANSPNDFFGLDRVDFRNNPFLISAVLKNSSLSLFGVPPPPGCSIVCFYLFQNTPNLKYLCVDEIFLNDFKDQVLLEGNVNCEVNSYCSFVPGGISYTIQGNNKLDVNNDGCDVSDVNFPNFSLNVTGGVDSGNFIANTNGDYNFSVRADNYTVTPVIENPTYFNVTPSTVNVTFPTQASPFTQNFCVATNGAHPDLEVSILPIVGARPGFDATYKIIYKNKGNTTQSGTVNLVFNDAVLDLVVANPVTTSQSLNDLSWNFTNLLPFETREITLTLNVNAPTDTPAVNDGDVLDFTTTITSPATDDTPNDNTITFHQTVVNSFDPNDKTCVEGTTISPTMVGEYVHYVIRFENTGTYPAENIVVKDMIDLSKFDINSLIPIKGSHEFVTNITAGNKVEFIFENINLPFDDANNDGFVAFKIKTKSSLVVGDTFSNSANIYFDYNFPIVTNTATTTIAALSVQDFVFSNYFSIYPNPVSEVLNISAKENIEVSSINIYNTLGQLALVIPNAQNTKTVDVSSLTTGNYFIKINSNKGTSNTKFIKN
jgi:hypothetical protein